MELFRNERGELLLADDSKLASILGFNQRVIPLTPSPKMLGTGVFDTLKKKILSEDELKELLKEVEDLYNKYCEASVEEIKEIAQRYLFVLECDYRGGEKHKTIVANVCDEPEYMVADEVDYPEFWECEPIAVDVWNTLREIVELRKADQICE